MQIEVLWHWLDKYRPLASGRDVGRKSFSVASFLKFIVAAITMGPALTSAATQQNVELKIATGILYGTLTLPENAVHKRCPVVLIIAGSGPTDRDGNNRIDDHHTDSYRQLGDALAVHGIASLRYDKRGVGESHGALISENQLQFDDFVDDALGWARLLRADTRFSNLVIVGHSEGSLIGIIASRRLPADALVSLEGAGEPISRVLEQQLKTQLPPDLYEQSQSIIQSLEHGKRVDQVPAELAMLFRPSVQRMDISWFRIDPRKEISQLSIPVLIVQGQEDEQIGLTNAEQLQKANPKAQLLILPHMGHSLIDVAPASSSNLTKSQRSSILLDPNVISGVVTFINDLPAKQDKKL